MNDPPTQEKASAVNFRQKLNCDFLHVGFPNQLGFLWLAIEIFFGGTYVMGIPKGAG